jgi:hypothetical protein
MGLMSPGMGVPPWTGGEGTVPAPLHGGKSISFSLEEEDATGAVP